MIGLPRAIIVFSYRIYFELNPAGGLPNYGGAAAVSLPFLVFGVLLLLALQPHDPPRRELRHRDRQGLSPAPASARPLARARRCCSSALYVAMAACCRRRCWCGPASSATRCRRARPRPTSASTPYRQLFANPAFWIGLQEHAAGRRRLGRDRHRHRRHARLDHLALSASAAGALLDFLSFMSVGIPAVIVGLAVMMLYLSLPIGIYGTVVDPDPRLFVPLRHDHAARARRLHADPPGAGGGLGRLGRALARPRSGASCCR